MDAIKIAYSNGAGLLRIMARQRTIDLIGSFHAVKFTSFVRSLLEDLVLKQAQRRIVVLISGRGSNMQAIVRIAQTLPEAQVCAVIANRSDAAGLVWAREQGLETRVLAHEQFANREAFDTALGDLIATFEPDYILLAGFMRILTAGFVRRFANRVVNIHPSLLPAFPGLHTHRKALEMGVQWHGCTVHFVTPTVDHGPVIAQGAVAVQPEDTESSLAQRVLTLEHVVYTQVVQWLVQGRIHLDAHQRVRVEGVEMRSFLLDTGGAVRVQDGYA